MLSTAYRCCYCGFWNPAKKQKPFAPKLDIDNSNYAAPSNTSEFLTANTEPSNTEEESVKHAESETCTQSDTGIIIIYM